MNLLYFSFFSFFFLIFYLVFAIIQTSRKGNLDGFFNERSSHSSGAFLGSQIDRMVEGYQALNLQSIKSIVMQNVPMVAGPPIDYELLKQGCYSDFAAFDYKVTSDTYRDALRELIDEQCMIMIHNNREIRPTQYGINKYS